MSNKSITSLQQSNDEDNIGLIKTLDDLGTSNTVTSQNMSKSIKKLIARSLYNSERIYKTIESSNNKVMTKLVDILLTNRNEHNSSIP